MPRANIAVMTNVNFEAFCEQIIVDFVGAKEEHKLGFFRRECLDPAVKSITKHQSAHPCSGKMQDIETVPAIFDETKLLRQRQRRTVHAVIAQRPAANDNCRALCGFQRIGQRFWSCGQC